SPTVLSDLPAPGCSARGADAPGGDHRHRLDLDHELRSGETLHPDQGARGQVAHEVLEALIGDSVVLLHIRRERRGLDHVREIRADGAKRPADVLAHLAELRAHVAGMYRRGVLLATGRHPRDEDQSPAGDGDDLGVRLAHRQVSGLDDLLRMGHRMSPPWTWG